jgi:hypothetical protein
VDLNYIESLEAGPELDSLIDEHIFGKTLRATNLEECGRSSGYYEGWQINNYSQMARYAWDDLAADVVVPADVDRDTWVWENRDTYAWKDALERHVAKYRGVSSGYSRYATATVQVLEKLAEKYPDLYIEVSRIYAEIGQRDWFCMIGNYAFRGDDLPLTVCRAVPAWKLAPK